MPFSLKILVHEIKLVVSEVLLIEEPILSVTFANYPKIFIKGRSKLSTASYEKVFSHGKSALLQVDQERLEEILKEQPLELMLLNGTRILAGGRINLDQFIHTINLEFRFKRGNFHLLDHFGKPYALADISISIHDVNLEPPEVPTIKQLMNGQIEPPPDEIVYKKKNQKPPIDKKAVESPVAYAINQQETNENSNNERASQKLYTKPIPKGNQHMNDKNNNINNNNKNNNNNNDNNNNNNNNYNNKNTSKSTSQQKVKDQKQVIKQIYSTKPKAKSKYAQQTPKPKSPLKTKNNGKQRPQSANIQVKAQKLQAVYVKKPENLEDIPIEVWANGNHCPPPMILDKKIYVHQVFNAPEEKLPVYVKQHQTNSIAIQTDYVLPQATTQIYHSQSQHRQQTQQSDGYQDDFESVSQSHSQLIVNKSPKTGPKIVQKSIKETDEVSDIYEDDFEQMSHSFKRSQSLKSYIPDFESISQSRR